MFPAENNKHPKCFIDIIDFRLIFYKRNMKSLIYNASSYKQKVSFYFWILTEVLVEKKYDVRCGKLSIVIFALQIFLFKTREIFNFV